jgi:NAD(P)-dependent dehydrogenase (short-subunit alcohol dehydrogenase family)
LSAARGSAITLVAAAELERYGVRVNAIAPIARTRLTLATPGMGAVFAAGAFSDSGHDLFDPSNISPLVAYLASAGCPLTGKVFAVQGGCIQELSGWSTTRQIETDGPWQIGEIAARLEGHAPVGSG